jgi:hypothetical protein
MILQKSILYVGCFVVAAATSAYQVVAEGGNLRSSNTDVRSDTLGMVETQPRVRRLSPTAECTLLISIKLQIDPTSVEDGDSDEQFECQLDSLETGGIENLAYPLDISREQKKELKQLMKEKTLCRPGSLGRGQSEASCKCFVERQGEERRHNIDWSTSCRCDRK